MNNIGIVNSVAYEGESEKGNKFRLLKVLLSGSFITCLEQGTCNIGDKVFVEQTNRGNSCFVYNVTKEQVVEVKKAQKDWETLWED